MRKWERAAEAIDLDQEEVKDVAAMADEELAGVVQQWDDAIDAAPPCVKGALDAKHNEHRHEAIYYAREVARATVIGPNMRRMAARVERLKAELDGLQAQHEQRASWYDDTADLREAAQEARSELARRADVEAEPLALAREDMTDAQTRAYELRQQELRRQSERDYDSGMSMDMDLQ